MSHLRGSRNYVWNVSDILGVGATGAVYKCRNKRTGELFAVKTFNANSYGRLPDVQMREFDVLQKLKHENIVQLHAIEEEAGTNLKVLVMDLCTGGSLFSMLDDPENAYGLREMEFLCVLRDVAAGMKHLHDTGIVHRDLKPGNIMRYISEDGRSIYKLIDFGAARELQEEEQFVSLYGTEEYLVDMYERAVLQRKTSKQFSANVDLWSIGVTLYHVAAGHLPFRPFGGPRRNRELMYALTTQRESGVISGVQHVADGPIEWSRNLPSSCRLSQGLKQLVTPLLARLLESDPEKIMKFEEFFNEVQRISSRHVVTVFHVTTCSLMKVYMNGDEKFAHFQDEIAMQTKVRSTEQQLIYENHELLTLVSENQPVSSYPLTSSQNPIFLFSVGEKILTMESLNMDGAVFSSNIPKLPTPPSNADKLDLDVDALYAKNLCSVAYCIGHIINELLRDQQLIIKAAKMFRLVMAHDIGRAYYSTRELESLIAEIGKRIRLLSTSCGVAYGMLDKMSAVKCGELVNPADSFAKQNKRYTELKEEVADVVGRLEKLKHLDVLQPTLDTLWQEDSSCREDDRCIKKSEILISSMRQTCDDFVRDKRLKHLSYNEEQIHKFDRNKLRTNASVLEALILNHCLPNTQGISKHFISWCSQMLKIQTQRNDLKSKIHKVSAEHEILNENLDQMQEEQLDDITAACKQLGVSSALDCSSPKIVASSSNNLVFRPSRSRDETVNRLVAKKIRTLVESLKTSDDTLTTIKENVDANEKLLLQLRDGESQHGVKQQKVRSQVCGEIKEENNTTLRT